jgi:hypothetical protein
MPLETNIGMVKSTSQEGNLNMRRCWMPQKHPLEFPYDLVLQTFLSRIFQFLKPPEVANKIRHGSGTTTSQEVHTTSTTKQTRIIQELKRSL